MLFLLMAPAPTPVTLSAQAGQTVTLTVRLPAPDSGVLLNRGAPNSLILKTPWGQWKKSPSGRPFVNGGAEFSGYFGQVHPVILSFKVPARTPPGPHNAQLALQLFTCNRQEKLCQQKDLTYPLTIQVGDRQQGGRLDVPASALQRPFKPGG
ncbi:hypothetical protein [Deinococcus fonticola]|uniref:hypothetical protein n=1 Tax=Deinococcus fonticola TaxID=2528713 RepID=UPI001075558D|nr:hypothetical protein [Deinococcus fonticola]